MEFIAIEAFRTALQNPAFAENVHRRRSSSFSEAFDTNGKIGNLLRRMSIIRSTTSSTSVTPNISRSNSRSSSPSRIAVAVPVLSVVPPSVHDNISSSQHTEICDSPLSPMHDHNDQINVEQRLYMN